MKNIITPTILLSALVFFFTKPIDKNKIDTVYLPITTAVDQIKLPIEVIGEEGKIVERTFTIDNQTSSNTSKIWLMVNNLSYQNKGSIKINNTDWLPLNHSTTEIYAKELAYGGMVHGGFNTIRFTIPATGLVAGNNTIKFRFNTSDGISIGYRVVRMNLVNSNGTKLLADSNFEQDNPNDWVAPDNSSVSRGKDLWYNKDLMSHYLTDNKEGFWYNKKLPSRRSLRAKCTDCHTQDGRDLEIFSYSNSSIIERSKFHGMSEQEGKDIAAYIRSLSNISKVGRYGRPWNPPYQPGPAIKNKPIEQWAAGAGLDAVLESDADMLPYLFPNGTGKNDIRAAFDSDKMDDRTILPLAIQFPDWKHWLPIVHPYDAYNKNNWFDNLPNSDHPIKNYNTVREELTNDYNVNNIRNFDLPDKLDYIGRGRDKKSGFRYLHEIGASKKRTWRSEGGDAVKHLSPGIDQELANTSLARLLAVKSFEVVTEYDLQDKMPLIVNAEDQPADRQWPTGFRDVFDVPPHITSNSHRQYEGQLPQTGHFETTVWYSLQFVINGGNGLARSISPVDWNYHNPFIGFSNNSSGIDEPLRYFSGINHMYQVRSYSKSDNPGSQGFRIRNQGPWTMMGASDSNQEFWSPSYTIIQKLDDIESGLSVKVFEALLLQFLNEVEKHDPDTWPRVAPHGNNHELDPATKRTSDLVAIPHTGNPNSGRMSQHYADKMYDVIPRIKDNFNVQCGIINRMVDWSKSVWPLIDFEKFRINNCSDEVVTCDAPEIVPNGMYSIKTTHDKCINAVSSNGYNVTQQTCNDNNTGKWILKNAGAGYYFIKNIASGQYIQATGTNNGDRVEAAAFLGNDAQRWEIKTTNNCKFNIVSKSANKCLDLKSGNSANGAYFQVWSCTSSENREYSFELLDDVIIENNISITKTNNATEGVSDASFRVSLDNNQTNQTGSPITGKLTLTGTATKGTDYINVSSFSIPTGQNAAIITIQVTDDTEVEDTETIIATISNPSSGNISSSNKATATINDNDQGPEYRLSIEKTTDAIEGSTDAIFTVSIDGGNNNETGNEITGYVTLTGTASINNDYTNVTSFSIPNSENQTQIIIPILDDNDVEGQETIIATISNTNTGTISTNNTSTATIQDNDQESITISIVKTTDATEGSTDAIFTVSIDGGNNNETDNEITGSVTLTGTASINNDYTNVTSFSIPNGENQTQIIIPILDDNDVEGQETIIATISNTNTGTISTNNSATATITDNECESLQIISNGSYKITTTNDKCISSIDADAYTVTQQTCNDTDDKKWTLQDAGSGFYFIKNKLTNNYLHAAGLTDGSFVNETPFTGNNDQQWKIVELPNCLFKIDAKTSNLSVDLRRGESNDGNWFRLFQYIDNENAVNKQFSFEFLGMEEDTISLSIIKTTDAVEGGTDAVFTVSVDQGSNATGNPITGTITFTGTASINNDYTNITSFSIPDGENQTQIIIPVMDDNEVEGSETIIATISNPNTGTISSNNTATATIQDNDQESITISIAKTTDAIEGDTDAIFTVSIDGGKNNETGNEITGSVTLTGTATVNDDYTNVTSFSISNDENQTQIIIPILDDNDIEEIETIIATISNTSIGTIVNNNSNTVTITDNDTSTSCSNPINISAGYIYHITTKHDKYISAITSNGYTITQQSNNENDSSKWVLENADAGYYFIKNLATARYIQTTGSNNGNHVEEANFTGNENQQWQINSTADCKFTIVSKSANKCLDLKSGNSADGTRFQIWNCDNPNNEENRKYTFELLGEASNCDSPSIRNKSVYQIKTKHNKSIDGSGSGNIHQWNSHGKNNQKWILEDSGNGYYYIKNIRSYQCMTVQNTSINGANIEQNKCNDSENQQWKISLLDNCKFSIQSKATNKCLDLKNGQENNGTNIQQWSCMANNENQEFSFELLEDDKQFGLDNINVSDILVFPNPTNSILNVKIPSNDLGKSAEVRVYNFVGKLIKKETTKEDLISMSLENLPTGQYIVRVVSNKKTYDKIIVKE